MLDAFRLMLIYTLIDPLRISVGGLFSAIGQPGLVVRVRIVQLGMLALGLLLLVPRFGIAGVAVAVDLMAIMGIASLLAQARVYVDLSLGHLFVVPTLALAIGVALAAGASTLPFVTGSDWLTGTTKTIVFLLVYSSILLIAEKQQISQMWQLLKSYARASRAPGTAPLIPSDNHEE